jgi:UPF0042 nucleotide-binding protein
MKIVIITGLSGAGKSYAANVFEDFGYYCIDNLPPSLIPDFVVLLAKGTNKIEKAALVVDVRGGEFFDSLQGNLELLRNKDISCRILFLEASDDSILRRYGESRRQHPLAKGQITNAEALEEERALLSPLKAAADYVIDTTGLKQAALSARIRDLFAGGEPQAEFTVYVSSFGYKYGVPKDADYVLDMRFIPNPFYMDSLRELNGNDPEVRDYVLGSPEAKEFVGVIIAQIKILSPAYIREGKNSLHLYIGCTGGQHRSVAIANEIGERLKKEKIKSTVTHRDLP